MEKILIFSHEFPPFGGGAGVVALQYCLALSKLNFKIKLLTVDGIDTDGLENIDIIKIPKIDKIWPIFYIKKLKQLNLGEFDFIYLNDIGAIYIAGLSFSNQILAKSVTLLHGSEPDMMYNNVKLFHKLFLYPIFYQRAITKCKKIIAVSKYMKNKFIEETHFKDSSKIEICYAGLDDQFFKNNRIKCSESNNKKLEILLTVSRIEKGKGFLKMYSIFKNLIKKNNGYKWLIAGNGTFKKEFEKIIKGDRLSSKIVFLGLLARKDLIKYYICSDVFWLLSEYKESFGLVYLEAQACGCPAIGYNRYGVKEAILDKKTGFLVDDESEVLEILLEKKYKSLQLIKYNHFIKSFKTDQLVKTLMRII